MLKGLLYVMCIIANSIALFLTAFTGHITMSFVHGLFVIFAGQMVINKFIEGDSNDRDRTTH